jgi:hypothetical protein
MTPSAKLCNVAIIELKRNIYHIFYSDTQSFLNVNFKSIKSGFFRLSDKTWITRYIIHFDFQVLILTQKLSLFSNCQEQRCKSIKTIRKTPLVINHHVQVRLFVYPVIKKNWIFVWPRNFLGFVKRKRRLPFICNESE